MFSLKKVVVVMLLLSIAFVSSTNIYSMSDESSDFALNLSTYEKIVMDGFVVYRDNSIFNFDKQNIDRMNKGFAPIGTDGKPVNLHHLFQSRSGPLVELTDTFHHEHHKELHSSEERTQIDRESFDEYRQRYWRNRFYDKIKKSDKSSDEDKMIWSEFMDLKCSTELSNIRNLKLTAIFI